MTGDQAYDAIVGIIEAVTPDSSRRRIRFKHWDGPVAETPTVDGTFRLDILAHDRLTERMGCDERWIEFELAIVYADTEGAQRRALADGDDIITSFQTFMQTDGITDLQELGGRWDRNVPGYLLVTHALRVAYSGV